jgi:chromosome segregation ATPase
MPAAIRAFCQETHQPAPNSEGALLRCALESLALRYRMVLGFLEELIGNRIETIHIVGGGAKKDQIVNAFRILTSDPSVKGVLINIFGGILRCDVLAQGVVEAASELNLQLPVVVRMEGTNVDRGKQIVGGREAASGIFLNAAIDDHAERLRERDRVPRRRRRELAQRRRHRLA